MKSLRVLVACESSGTVRDAFLRRGFDAMSCDLLDTVAPGPHYKGDVRDVLDDGWDLLIAHPPCTYLSVSGMHWTTRGLRDPKLTEDALDFARLFLEYKRIPKRCVENPASVISTRIRPKDQVVQPYEFGHDASKTTWLWLDGLPPLVKDPARRVPGRLVEHNGKMVERWANQTDSGQNALPPSKDRWRQRSVTYAGIADAMAEQWGAALLLS